MKFNSNVNLIVQLTKVRYISDDSSQRNRKTVLQNIVEITVKLEANEAWEVKFASRGTSWKFGLQNISVWNLVKTRSFEGDAEPPRRTENSRRYYVTKRKRERKIRTEMEKEKVRARSTVVDWRRTEGVVTVGIPPLITPDSIKKKKRKKKRKKNELKKRMKWEPRVGCSWQLANRGV